MIKPVFTQHSPRILAGFVSLLRFFSRLVPNKPVGCGLKASERFLLVLVKLKQAVQKQDLVIRKNLPNVSRVNTAHYMHASSTVQMCSLNNQFLVWLEVRRSVTVKAMIL